MSGNRIRASAVNAGRSKSGLSVPRVRTTGHSLPAADRAFFEERLGQDFSRVRVHSDETAAASADALSAKAFTAGEDIFFAAGRYRPGAPEGRRLLAHELTHVAQQGRGGAASTDAEPRAHAAAERAARGETVPAQAQGGASPGVYCDNDDQKKKPDIGPLPSPGALLPKPSLTIPQVPVGGTGPAFPTIPQVPLGGTGSGSMLGAPGSSILAQLAQMPSLPRVAIGADQPWSLSPETLKSGPLIGEERKKAVVGPLPSPGALLPKPSLTIPQVPVGGTGPAFPTIPQVPVGETGSGFMAGLGAPGSSILAQLAQMPDLSPGAFSSDPPWSLSPEPLKPAPPIGPAAVAPFHLMDTAELLAPMAAFGTSASASGFDVMGDWKNAYFMFRNYMPEDFAVWSANHFLPAAYGARLGIDQPRIFEKAAIDMEWQHPEESHTPIIPLLNPTTLPYVMKAFEYTGKGLAYGAESAGDWLSQKIFRVGKKKK